MLAFSLQGGGISVDSGGVANLDGCYVYENVATSVRSHHELTFSDLSSSAPLQRGWQNGGGIQISSTATLTNTNVYSNQAGKVSAPRANGVEVRSILTFDFLTHSSAARFTAPSVL